MSELNMPPTWRMEELGEALLSCLTVMGRDERHVSANERRDVIYQGWKALEEHFPDGVPVKYEDLQDL